jgi:hypothetical protein
MGWFVTRLFPSFDNPLGLQESALIRELKVKQRGRSDGRRNYPDTHESQLSETEQRILARFENAANELRQSWVDRWRRGGSKVDALAFTAWEQDYESPVTIAKSKTEEGRQHQRDIMVSARNTERTALRELNLFRRNNELDRDAKYPDVPLMGFAILFSLTIMESAVNANLFAQVTDWGLTGGLFYALAISLPNVVGGALVGFFSIRAMFHVHWFAKLLGIFFTFAGVGALLLYNFYISHFRAILASNSNAGLEAVPSQVLSDPLAFLSSREAVILLFVGVATMVLAIWKGTNGFSDTYWGYAYVDKKHKATLVTYDNAKATYRASFHSAIEAAQNQIQRKIENVDTKVTSVLNITRDIFHELEIVQTAMQASAHACRAALNVYRHENMMIRTTPKPTYFDEYPNFSDKLPQVGGVDFTTRRDQILALAKSLHDIANAALANLHEHAKSFADGVEADIREAEVETDRRRQRDQSETRETVPYRRGGVS